MNENGDREICTHERTIERRKMKEEKKKKEIAEVTPEDFFFFLFFSLPFLSRSVQFQAKKMTDELTLIKENELFFLFNAKKKQLLFEFIHRTLLIR